MAEVGEQEKGAETQPPDGGWQSRKSPFERVLAALLSDPLLQDLPRRPTLADVETLIGVELGSGMRLTILKMDGTSFDVAVLNHATVRDLKIAVQKKVTELEQAHMGHRHISWKHVWGNFCLAFNHQKLLDEASPLKEYGIKTNDQNGGDANAVVVFVVRTIFSSPHAERGS